MSKRPTANRPRCDQCHAWRRLFEDEKETKPFLAMARNLDGSDKVDAAGKTVPMRDVDGRFVTRGLCTIKAPKLYQLQPGLFTMWPETRANQGCHDPRKLLAEIMDMLRAITKKLT